MVWFYFIEKVLFNSCCSIIQKCSNIHLYNNHHVVKSTRLRPVLEYMFMLYISLIIRCNCRPLWLSAFLFGFSLRALKHNNWFYLRSSLLNKKTQFWYLCFFNYVSARYDYNILFWLHYYSGNYSRKFFENFYFCYFD